MIKFIVTDKKRNYSSEREPNSVYLTFSSWNDYSYRTLFNMEYVDAKGYSYSIGQIKIGFIGQDIETTTFDKIKKDFNKLDDMFFSLAESAEFYQKLYSFGKDLSRDILNRLNCVVVSENAIKVAKKESVFKSSLLRDVNINTIHGQFLRIMNGDSLLTEFDFQFVRKNHKFSDINLDFSVEPYSLPPSNIHAIIGRNGLGKTTLLNEMVSSIVGDKKPKKAFFEEAFTDKKIIDDYFSTVISVSFSAFDPFNPFSEQSDPLSGTCYYYIGLKKTINKEGGNPIEDIRQLRQKCAQSIYNCCSDDSKREAWVVSTPPKMRQL